MPNTIFNADRAMVLVENILRPKAVEAIKARDMARAVKLADEMGRVLNPLIRRMNVAAGGVVEYRLTVVRHLRTDGPAPEVADEPVPAGQ
jgi:hypothetical protein